MEPGSSPRQHVENPLQRRGVNIAVDANSTSARKLDLDQPGFLASPATRRPSPGCRLLG
jgi:hypothetical protein